MSERPYLRLHLVVLLTLLLPSSALCGLCTVEACPMQPEPEPVETVEVTPCHQEMVDSSSGTEPSETASVVMTSSLMPECCAVSSEADGEAPGVLTQAPASVFLVDAGSELDVESTSESSRHSSPAPPKNQPLYHLHSSLLI